MSGERDEGDRVLRFRRTVAEADPALPFFIGWQGAEREMDERYVVAASEPARHAIDADRASGSACPRRVLAFVGVVGIAGSTRVGQVRGFWCGGVGADAAHVSSGVRAFHAVAATRSCSVRGGSHRWRCDGRVAAAVGRAGGFRVRPGVLDVLSNGVYWPSARRSGVAEERVPDGLRGRLGDLISVRCRPDRFLVARRVRPRGRRVRGSGSGGGSRRSVC